MSKKGRPVKQYFVEHKIGNWWVKDFEILLNNRYGQGWDLFAIYELLANEYDLIYKKVKDEKWVKCAYPGPALEKERYVYIMHIKNSDKYKIGIAKDVIGRFASMLTHNPDIEIFYSEKVNDAPILEKQLHKKYIEYNISGEWFKLDNKKVEECKGIIKENKYDEKSMT